MRSKQVSTAQFQYISIVVMLRGTRKPISGTTNSILDYSYRQNSSFFRFKVSCVALIDRNTDTAVVGESFILFTLQPSIFLNLKVLFFVFVFVFFRGIFEDRSEFFDGKRVKDLVVFTFFIVFVLTFLSLTYLFEVLS